MVASCTGVVKSAEGRLLWPRGIGDGVLRESRLCQRGGMQKNAHRIHQSTREEMEAECRESERGWCSHTFRVDGEMICFWR